MIQVSIKKQDQITNQASFPTTEEAQSWLSYHESMKSFGEPSKVIRQEVEITPATFDENGDEVSAAVFDNQEVIIQGDYAILIEDISTKLQQEQINTDALAFLNDADWKRQRHLSQKALGIPTSLSEQEYLFMEQECQNARNRIVR